MRAPHWWVGIMWLLRRQAQLPFACFYLPVLCHGMTNKQVLPDASTLNQHSQSTKLCVRKELSVYHFLLSLWYQDSRMIACSFLEYLGPWEPNIWLGFGRTKSAFDIYIFANWFTGRAFHVTALKLHHKQAIPDVSHSTFFGLFVWHNMQSFYIPLVAPPLLKY